MSSAASDPPRPRAHAAPPWAAPAALLGVEFLALSTRIEFPTAGSALPLVDAARKLIPVVVGGGAAALLIARTTRPGDRAPLPAWPAGRPPALAVVLQLVAFLACAALGESLMAPGAGPVSAGAFATWLVTVAATFAAAAALAAPPLALAHRALRALAVPLLALGAGLLSWRAIAASAALWEPLQALTLAGVAALLHASTAAVEIDPGASVIGIPPFVVEIAPTCSGIDGIGLVLLFQAVWLSLTRARVRFARALLVLVPAGVVAAFVANVLRISALILLGAAGHRDLALGAFHSKLGWILFLAIAFGTIAAAEHVRWLREERGPAEPVGVPPAAAAHLAPLVVAIAMGLVTSLWARGGLDPLYGLRIVAAAAALLLVRRDLPRPALSVSWVAVGLGVVVGVAWIAWGGAPRSTLGVDLARLGAGWRVAWVAVRLAGACLVIPLVEELAFRGFLLPWLVAPDDDGLSARGWTWPSVLLSSIAFGALHERWLLGAAAGVAFAAARTWRGRLSDAIVAHAVANAAVAAAAVALGRWDLLG